MRLRASFLSPDFLIYVFWSNANVLSIFFFLGNKTFFLSVLLRSLSYTHKHKFSVKFITKMRDAPRREAAKIIYEKCEIPLLCLNHAILMHDKIHRWMMLPNYDALDMIKLKCWRWQWWWWLRWRRQPRWSERQICECVCVTQMCR